MASSPLNPKTNHHARSNSLPTRPHPLILQCDEHLSKLGSSAADPTPLTPSSITHELNGLQDLHQCVNSLLLLPKTQETFLHEREEKWVDELLDGSLRLLDMCSAAKDAVIHTRECARELQSVVRRRGPAENVLANGISKFLASRKVVKKQINKTLGNIKNNGTKYSKSTKEEDTIAFVNMLREVDSVSVTIFESLLCIISGQKAKSKANGWSLVCKLMHSKRAICDEADQQAVESNEFANVDAALLSVAFHQIGKGDGINMNVDEVTNHLEKLEMCTQGLEQELEGLFRRLIRNRVSLLNIINN